MKSVLKGKQKTEKQKKYPYLGIATETGRVVLFERKNTGTVVHEVVTRDTVYGPGHYSGEWTEQEFEPLKGEIVLSN